MCRHIVPADKVETAVQSLKQSSLVQLWMRHPSMYVPLSAMCVHTRLMVKHLCSAMALKVQLGAVLPPLVQVQLLFRR